MQRKLLFLILSLALCFYVWGCGDEGIETVLHDIGAAPSVEGVIGPVPEHVKAICWGKDVETLKARLQDALDRGNSLHVDGYIHQICRRREQEVYYTKYISAGGIAIMGNSYIHDRFFYAARDIALGMTSKRPELRALLTPSPGPGDRPGAKEIGLASGLPPPSHKFRYILLHRDRNFLLVPEFRLGGGVVNFDRSVKGLGGTYGADATWGFVDGYSSSHEISIYHNFSHEVGHAIHGAIQLLDPTFNDRLRAAYEHKVEGVVGRIGAGSWEEYWAIGVTHWFGETASDVAAYDEFRKRDPLLVELLEEWFDLIDLRAVESKVYE